MIKRPLISNHCHNVTNNSTTNKSHVQLNSNLSFDQKNFSGQTNHENLSILEKHFYRNNYTTQKENVFSNTTEAKNLFKNCNNIYTNLSNLGYVASKSKQQYGSNHSFELGKQGDNSCDQAMTEKSPEMQLIQHYIKTEADDPDDVQPIKQTKLKARARA